MFSSGIAKSVKNSVSSISSSFTHQLHAGVERNIAQWYTEIVSAKPPPPPDRINNFFDIVSSDAPKDHVAGFNLNCRFRDYSWKIKGLQINQTKKGEKPEVGTRSIILASGLHGNERGTVSVSLYVASVLSRFPLANVDLTIIPMVNPRDFQQNWKAGEAFEGDPISICPKPQDNMRDVTSDILQKIVMRNQGRNYVSVQMDLSTVNSELMFKGNYLQNSYSGHFKVPISYPKPTSATPAAFVQMLPPPAIVIELRDKADVLEEEHIAKRGAEVIVGLQRLIQETSQAPRIM